MFKQSDRERLERLRAGREQRAKAAAAGDFFAALQTHIVSPYSDLLREEYSKVLAQGPFLIGGRDAFTVFMDQNVRMMAHLIVGLHRHLGFTKVNMDAQEALGDYMQELGRVVAEVYIKTANSTRPNNGMGGLMEILEALSRGARPPGQSGMDRRMSERGGARTVRMPGGFIFETGASEDDPEVCPDCGEVHDEPGQTGEKYDPLMRAFFGEGPDGAGKPRRATKEEERNFPLADDVDGDEEIQFHSMGPITPRRPSTAKKLNKAKNRKPRR